MQTYPEIKRFVQVTLGCSCPEDVFNKIDYEKEIDGIPGRKITVGDRLLIYMITLEGKSGIRGVIHSALEQGVVERDKKGLNRFRLVLLSYSPDEIRKLAEHSFDSSGYKDEKSHLHVLNASNVLCF